jgi:hypothetical protein
MQIVAFSFSEGGVLTFAIEWLVLARSTNDTLTKEA